MFTDLRIYYDYNMMIISILSLINVNKTNFFPWKILLPSTF